RLLCRRKLNRRNADRYRREAERGKEHGLRLDQHGRREQRKGDQIPALTGSERAQNDEKRKDRIDLSPGGGIHEYRRIEQEEQTEEERGTLPKALFGKAVYQHGSRQVEQDGNQ